MRYYKNNKGPFPLGIYFEDQEIESAAFEQLQKASMIPNESNPCVDIDALLKANFGIDPDFEDLDDGVLGKSEFYRDGSIRVIIATSLGEDCNGTKENLYRTTMAHEIGHVVLHRILFLEDTLKLEGVEGLKNSVYPVLCRSDSSGQTIREYSGEWWEWQANRFMSAILMSKHVITKKCNELWQQNPNFNTKQIKDLLIDFMSKNMKVSKQACEIRLSQLNVCQSNENQFELAI